MIIIVLNAEMNSNKIEILILRNLKDVSKLVMLECSRLMNFMRNLIRHVKNALIALIIIVQIAQMDLYKMQLEN